jgi:hypothetical protein
MPPIAGVQVELGIAILRTGRALGIAATSNSITFTIVSPDGPSVVVESVVSGDDAAVPTPVAATTTKPVPAAAPPATKPVAAVKPPTAPVASVKPPTAAANNSTTTIADSTTTTEGDYTARRYRLFAFPSWYRSITGSIRRDGSPLRRFFTLMKSAKAPARLGSGSGGGFPPSRRGTGCNDTPRSVQDIGPIIMP